MTVEAMGNRVRGHAVLFEMTNWLWWPNQLDLSAHHQNRPQGIRWIRTLTTRRR